MATVIMGAALRMAVGMALHREPTSQTTRSIEFRSSPLPESRRRVWWSLFCLDSWASLPLDRPSLGRWDKDAIIVNLPSSYDIAGTSLRASVDFCKIATKVQDRFARLPLVSCKEIDNFDTQVIGWKACLPPMLQQDQTCPANFRMAKWLMNIRHQNLRLVLYRPRLLTTTVLRASFHANISLEEQTAANACRSIASEIIQGIQRDWFPNQNVVRSSVWFLFNACMVPLLGLLSDPNHEDAGTWRMDVEASLAFCDEVSSWSPVVTRTREVIVAIYEISNKLKNMESLTGSNSDFDLFLDVWNSDSFWNYDGQESWMGENDFGSELNNFEKIFY